MTKTRKTFTDGIEILSEQIEKPTPPTVISYIDFEARFETAEADAVSDWLHIVNTSTGLLIRPQRLRQYNRSVANNSIDLEAPSLITLMGELVTDGVLTVPRKDTIMTP